MLVNPLCESHIVAIALESRLEDSPPESRGECGLVVRMDGKDRSKEGLFRLSGFLLNEPITNLLPNLLGEPGNRIVATSGRGPERVGTTAKEYEVEEGERSGDSETSPGIGGEDEGRCANREVVRDSRFRDTHTVRLGRVRVRRWREEARGERVEEFVSEFFPPKRGSERRFSRFVSRPSTQDRELCD